MTFFPSGRLAAATRSGAELRPYLQAVIALGNARRPGVMSAAPSSLAPDAQLVYASIEQLPEAERERLAGDVLALLRARNRVRLGAWTRALKRTADRVGLVVCQSLLLAGQLVADEEGPEGLDPLINFALSLPYLDMLADRHAEAAPKRHPARAS